MRTRQEIVESTAGLRDARADDSKPRGRLGWLPTSPLGWVFLVLSVSLVPFTVVRAAGLETNVLAWAIAITPWFALIAVPALLLAVASRSVIAILLATAVCVLQLSWVVPHHIRQVPPFASTQALTIMTSNLLVGRADAATLVSLAREQNVDVLAMQEVTRDAVERLKAAGIARQFPYVVDGGDNLIWTRTPTRTLAVNGDDLDGSMLGARLSVAGQSLNFVDVHPAAPLSATHESWTNDQPILRQKLQGLDGPSIVAGDFNATLDHRIMRDLQAAGFTDSSAALGDGLTPTWPQFRPFVPFPLVAIDHVVYRDIRAFPLAVTSHVVPGSDHRTLIVKLAIGTG